MSLPFFYIESLDAGTKSIVLDEDTSRHVVQVLRMKVGEQLNLTDGRGNLITAEIAAAHKKHCEVKRQTTHQEPRAARQITIAISLLKSTNRFEWFLEKATELGISEIIPLICERTEKQKFRYDRMQGICISAMLQSQQTWLPVLHEPVEYKKVVGQSAAEGKFIAHCNEGPKDQLTNKPINRASLILIGPEGDFAKQEIDLAL
jgi:16S rRNA (uracil1498-N3)-methyltransferase